MKAVRTVIVALALLTCAACAHKYAVPEASGGEPILRAGASVYLVTPADGKDHHGRSYAESGSWTSAALGEALAARGVRVVAGDESDSFEAALGRARSRETDFLVFPEIDYWADHMTEWSGVPDRITIRVRVAEAASGETLDDRELRASSRWGTLGGDHPQELLPKLAEDWSGTLL